MAFESSLRFGGLAGLSKLVRRLRRNHALEHATVHVLAHQRPSLKLVGQTTPSGFYLYGDVKPAEVERAVREAMDLLRGAPELAIHPRCGTNLAVTGLLAGLAAFAVSARPQRPRWLLLPQVLLASLWAVLIAQPLGALVQQRLTTLAPCDGVQIGSIQQRMFGGVPATFVPLRWPE
jgi:hypothetical protein